MSLQSVKDLIKNNFVQKALETAVSEQPYVHISILNIDKFMTISKMAASHTARKLRSRKICRIGQFFSPLSMNRWNQNGKMPRLSHRTGSRTNFFVCDIVLILCDSDDSGESSSVQTSLHLLGNFIHLMTFQKR